MTDGLFKLPSRETIMESQINKFTILLFHSKEFVGIEFDSGGGFNAR